MKARICIVGKVPPLQGGVSRLTLETARRLGQRGYDVHLVTNAEETENFFKQQWAPSDAEYLEQLQSSGVFVHNLVPLDERTHIPYSPCFETRMCGRICHVVREFNCSIIVGWYLQPYGVAASMAARFTNRPYMIMHAGSDLAYLTEHPDLAVVHRQVLKDAAVVIHSPKEQVTTRLRKLGVDQTQLRACSGIPDLDALAEGFIEDVALPDVELDSTEFYRQLEAEYPDIYRSTDASVSRKTTDGPRILCAGKIAYSKNYGALFEALDQLAQDGVEFHLIQTLIGRKSDLKEHLALLEKLPRLRMRLTMLPPLTPWKIRTLMKQIDIGIYLESGFTMDFHTSGLPLEFLAANVALLISREGVNQGLLREILRDGLNAAIVEVPSNSGEIREKLRGLLTNPGNLHEMKDLGLMTLKHLSGKVKKTRQSPLIYQIISEFAESTMTSNDPDAQLLGRTPPRA